MEHKHHRRSIRLQYYDYSKAGYYFITICTQDRLHLFGEIVDGEMILGDAGRMVNKLWYEIINDFPNVHLHEFVIMPNHIHGIIKIVGADSISALKPMNVHEPMNTHEPIDCIESQRAEIDSAPTLGEIIQSFKRHTTLQYIKMVKNCTCPPFNKRIWQRNYYEHIIRDDVDYERVATYTINNPMTWKDDVLSKP